MKLKGYIDGKEVSFDFFPPNEFKASIPRNLTGIYIVELHAISDSGLETMYTSISVLIDYENMSIKIIDSNIKDQLLKSDIYAEIISHEFTYREVVE